MPAIATAVAPGATPVRTAADAPADPARAAMSLQATQGPIAHAADGAPPIDSVPFDPELDTNLAGQTCRGLILEHSERRCPQRRQF